MIAVRGFKSLVPGQALRRAPSHPHHRGLARLDMASGEWGARGAILSGSAEEACAPDRLEACWPLAPGDRSFIRK